MKRTLLSLWLAVVVCAAYAQQRTVTGKVTASEDGSSLPGVNVVVKGTTNGTVTDADGKFSISAPENASLIFSFIGLKTTEVPIGERSIVDVQLTLDITQLSEVVVTATGLEVSKDKLGYTTSKVSGASAQRSGEATLINSLSGKAAGVIINRSSGDPGAGSYIQIRGQSTITGANQPLIVVDGVPVYNSNIGTSTGGAQGNGGVVQQSRLNDLNANDIESYEVLKGASAGALWGARAANGVIMITTKKGSSDKGKINVVYSGSYSTDEILVKHPLQKSWGQGVSGYYYTNVLGNNLFGAASGLPYSFGDKIANRSGAADVTITDPLNANYRGYFQTPDGTKIYPIQDSDFDALGNEHGGKNSKTIYDPYDAIFGKGSYLDNNISLSGGDKTGNFYLSIGNLQQQGIVKANSDYNRTTIKFNTEKVFNKVIKVGTDLSYSRIVSNRIQQGSNVNGLFLGGLRTAPDFNNAQGYEGTYFDATGAGFPNRQLSYRNQIGRRADPVYDNPLWIVNNNKDKSEVDRFIAKVQVDATPIEWLTLTARIGADVYSDKRQTLYPVGSAGAANSGNLTLQTPREAQYNADFIARGTFELTKDLSLSALTGLNLNQRTFDNISGTVQAFTLTSDPPLNLGNSTAANRTPTNAFTQTRVAAWYGAAQFGYKEQVYLNMTGRAEAASTYGRSKSFTFFYPSADASWIFTKTLGLENKILNFGKIRASWGKVATQPTPYNTATYYNTSTYVEGWGSTVNSGSTIYGGGYEQGSQLGNNSLEPEIKTEIEIGGDFKFFDNRITLGATYFNNDVTGVLLPVAQAGSTGFITKYANAASLNNQGIEIELGADVIRTNNFKWNLYGNWTRLRNKVTDLAGTSSLFLAGFTGTSSRAVKDQPVGVLWGTDFKRDAANKLVLDANGFPVQSDTESVIGNPNNDWRAGVGSNFSYKGFSLNVLFEHSQGGDIWGGTRGALFNFGTHADTDHEVTLSPSEAATLKNAGGETIANYGSATSFGYPYKPNTDGSYTIRGYTTDFGGGKVVIDESWYTGLGSGFGPVASQFIEKATWTRLREISLGYSLNSDVFRKATKLKSVDFSITGRNLFLWTEFKGNDPETNLTGPTNGRGLDYFNNPATKSYVFTVRITY
jgi:TonB-linked SusC/RagA family outer membrane protein